MIILHITVRRKTMCTAFCELQTLHSHSHSIYYSNDDDDDDDDGGGGGGGVVVV